MVVDVGVVEERRRAPDLHALRARVDEEERLLVLRDREHDVDARLALARDEPLLAVQHPLAAFTHGSRGEAGEVGARPGLGERPRFAVLAVRDRSHVALDLLRRRDLVELTRPAIDDRESEPVRRLPRLLLERNLAQHREVTAAELRRHVQHREPGLACLRTQRGELIEIDGAALGDAFLHWVDLGFDEPADGLLQRTDVFGQLRNDHRARQPTPPR